MISTIILISGCSSTSSAIDSPELASGEPELTGRVTIINKAPEEPGRVIEELLASYFTDYFEALSSLESRDLTKYFDTENFDGLESSILNQRSLEYLINLRQLKKNDISFKRYEFTGEIVSFAPSEENELQYEIILKEYNTINFSFLPDIDSHTSGVDHHFLLNFNDDGEFEILSHQKFEDVYYLIEDLYNHEKELLAPEIIIDTEKILSEITNKLLLEAKDNIDERLLGFNEDSADHVGLAETLPTADHPYDREAAVANAMKWVSPKEVKRNPEWLVYDDRGGNCNNYVSQNIYAGGIPMDTKGYFESQWKFYDDRINSRQTPWGRSSSWTGVNEFYNYVKKNSGFGMVAMVSEDFFAGEIGDVIIYGTEERWKHAVIITDVIYDDEGNFIDYLINSNTTDRINYPVSAYGYHNTALIKIIGWNE